MASLTVLFQGVTTRHQQAALKDYFAHLHPTAPKLMTPCCGTFRTVKCALEAGYRPEDIEASDVSLFSSVLGYLFSEQPLTSLPLTVREDLRPAYEALTTDRDRAAFLWWAMYAGRLRDDLACEKQVKDALMESRDTHVGRFRTKLDTAMKVYRGIRYRMADLREYLSMPLDGQTVVLMSPPAYPKGYERMFNFHGLVEWTHQCQPFHYDKEILPCYQRSLESPAVFLWSAIQKVLPEMAANTVMVEDYGEGRVEAIVCTKPERLQGCRARGRLATKSAAKQGRPLKARIMPPDYQVTPQTKIGFLRVDEEFALYYRDLWAHKMGQVRAEDYYVMTLDGMVFGIVGMHWSELNRLVTDCIGEVFGFNAPSDTHPYINRLLMLALTCRDFKRLLLTYRKTNRLFELNGFQTTCFTRYRKLKTNTGILKIVKREKLKNGNYRLVYRTPFHDRSWEQCVVQFLADEAAKNRARAGISGELTEKAGG